MYYGSHAQIVFDLCFFTLHCLCFDNKLLIPLVLLLITTLAIPFFTSYVWVVVLQRDNETNESSENNNNKASLLKTLFTVVVETDTSSSSSINFVTGTVQSPSSHTGTVCSFSFYNPRSRNHTLRRLGGASKTQNKTQIKSLLFDSRNIRHQYQTNVDLKVGKPNDSSPSNADSKVGKPNDSSMSPIGKHDRLHSMTFDNGLLDSVSPIDAPSSLRRIDLSTIRLALVCFAGLICPPSRACHQLVSMIDYTA